MSDDGIDETKVLATRQQVAEAIVELQWDTRNGGSRMKRLSAKAQVRAFALLDCDGEDLFQEALAWALEKPRWPLSVPFDAFLHMRIKQMASDRLGRQKSHRGFTQNEMHVLEDSNDGLLLKGLENQDEVKAVFSTFSNDTEAVAVLLGIWRGENPEEICQNNNFSETQYATIRRRIRRKLDRSV